MKAILVLLTICLPFYAYSVEDCSHTPMNVRNLDEREIKGLNNYRMWVDDILVRGFKLNEKLTGNETDLRLLQLVIDNGPYGKNAEDELIIIGSTFGDILAKKLGMSWVVVEDEEGIDFALAYKNKCVFSFPQDMLVKRAEKGELGDLTDLFKETVKMLEVDINDPDVSTWKE